MNIRKRLTLVFIGLVILILTVSSVFVYVFFADHREEDFYNRLSNKAINSAKLLIQVEEVDATLLGKIEQENPTSLTKERVVIYNYQNKVLYSSDVDNAIPADDELLDEIRLEGEVRFSVGEYEVLGILYTDRYDRFVVLAAAQDRFGKRKMRALANIMAITFVISIVFVSFAGWVYSGRALKPISKVIDQVENISETSLNLRLDEGNRSDEIARLAMTFNQMLARLEKAFTAQKIFIANASHELRTPLTAITGKIEVNLLQARSPEQYEQVLQSLLKEVKNMSMLSNRLLMLAQTTGEGGARLLTPVRIDEILWQSKEDLLRGAPDYSINIDMDLELDDDLLTIPGDEQLLKAALANLMDNGCKYSLDRTVDVGVKSNGREIRIIFSDRGIGIPADQQPYIFEPFYRGQNAIGISGHGIGLSLVSKIVALHQGRISFQSDTESGTQFELFFPLKREKI
jgi:signal transduction histidine kinase